MKLGRGMENGPGENPVNFDVKLDKEQFRIKETIGPWLRMLSASPHVDFLILWTWLHAYIATEKMRNKQGKKIAHLHKDLLLGVFTVFLAFWNWFHCILFCSHISDKRSQKHHVWYSEKLWGFVRKKLCSTDIVTTNIVTVVITILQWWR